MCLWWNKGRIKGGKGNNVEICEKGRVLEERTWKKGKERGRGGELEGERRERGELHKNTGM